MRAATLMRPASGDTMTGLVGVLANVVLEHRRGREVIDRAFEEALDLAAVQVDRHHPLGAGRLEQVGDRAWR